MNKRKLTPAEIVAAAHRSDRPRFQHYLKELFTDFFELHGDRLDGDDPSILGRNRPFSRNARYCDRTAEGNKS